MDYTDFMVDRAQHMRPLEYDLSESYNALVRYLHDMGVLDNVPVATLGPAEILTASDALSAPLRSLVVGGNSVQDVTPTPDAPAPIRSVVNPVMTFAPSLQLEQGTIVDGAEASNTKRVRTVSTVDVSNTLGCVGWCTSGTFNWGAAFYNASGTYLSATNRWQTSGASVTVPSGAVKARLYFRIAEDTNVTPSDFIVALPSQATTVTLPVTLRGLPDGTKDSATYTYLRPSTREGWAWYGGEVTRRSIVVNLAGITSLTKNTARGDNVFYFGYSTAATLNETRMRCSNFEVVPIAQINNTSGKCAGSSKNINFSMPDGITTVADAISWFAANGGELLLELATPTTETIDPIELPSVIGPSCTIYATADATPTLTAEYIRDLSAAINDMQEAIADI